MTKDSDYIGIDYGMEKTNRDENFHFGVISQKEVLQSWADYIKTLFATLGDMAEPLSFTYEGDGYQASCGEDGDIFITKSPYFTYCMYCSPCAPGAGYLMSPNPAGIMTYCFGHDWFDSGKAPYPVYDVTNGTEVKE